MAFSLRRTVFVAVAGLALILFGVTSASLGQAAAAGPAGHWVGIFDIVHADGSVDPGDAYFAFVQSGKELSGTAGESAAKQSPITAGRVDAKTVSFEVVINPQMTVKVHLSLEGDRLHGTATGIPAEDGATITVDIRRADVAWHSASAVAHLPDRLQETVAGLDRRLFDAYNNCDLATLGALVTDDLEFYHDNTGLAVGRQPFVDSTRKYICGKVQRVLVPDSLQVYRLNHYGAVETGVHRFQHPGHEDEGVGEAKFVMIWQFKGGNWKLSRVISYDHAVAKP